MSLGSLLVEKSTRSGRGSHRWLERFPFLLVYMLNYKGDWAFRCAEPLTVISLLAFTGYIVSGIPPFGSSLLVFHASGVIPFYLFNHTAIRLRDLDNDMMFPRVTILDIVLAKSIGEFILKVLLIVLIVCPVAIYLRAGEWYPQNPLVCLEALLTTGFLGATIGVLSANIAAFIPPWRYALVILTRASLLISAVPAVMDRVPRPFRAFTLNNPLSHLVTWFRSGWYIDYPTATLDLWFVIKFGLACVFVTIAFEAGTRSFRNIT